MSQTTNNGGFSFWPCAGRDDVRRALDWGAFRGRSATNLQSWGWGSRSSTPAGYSWIANGAGKSLHRNWYVWICFEGKITCHFFGDFALPCSGTREDRDMWVAKVALLFLVGLPRFFFKRDCLCLPYGSWFSSWINDGLTPTSIDEFLSKHNDGERIATPPV